MTNNDILRSLRYVLNVNEAKLLEILKLSDFKVSPEDLRCFLKREDEPDYKNCGDKVLAHFLDGLIIFKRGKKADSQPLLPTQANTPDFSPTFTPLTNNDILKKIRVAFELKDDDIIRLIEKAGLKLSKTELSAFFRKPDHRNYRDCGNQFLRNLLRGMAL